MVILSDANLDRFDGHFVENISCKNFFRYQIRPADVKKALTSDESVNAFLILIGSLGSQAIKYVSEVITVCKKFIFQH